MRSSTNPSKTGGGVAAPPLLSKGFMMKNHRLRATFHVCSRTGWIAWITFFLLTSTLAAYGGNTTPKVLAKIDGKVLTSKDFASYLALFKGNTAYQPKTLKEKKRLLEYLIDRTLLLEAAKKEGYDNFDAKIVMSGDVMYDAAMYYKQKAGKPNINLPEKYILSTVHRAENTDNPERLQNIFTALNEIAASVPVVLPLHPRTRKILDTQNIDISNLHIIEPVGYLEMIWLITHSSLVMTDSGGLQKEAYFFEKQCITLRDETEWIELVTNGFNTITGADKRKIIDTVQKALAQKIIFDKKLYGNGDAAKIIIDSLTKY